MASKPTAFLYMDHAQYLFVVARSPRVFGGVFPREDHPESGREVAAALLVQAPRRGEAYVSPESAVSAPLKKVASHVLGPPGRLSPASREAVYFGGAR